MKNIHCNLSVVLLDDDEMSLLQLRQIIATHNIARINATFNSPENFLNKYSRLDFDILILDCEMPGISGKEIIKKVGGERCIVNTGSKERYEDAIKCHPIDILIKPANEKHLINALEKARKMIGYHFEAKKFYPFRTMGSNDKVNIEVKDIVYVATHFHPRNKLIQMRDGTQHILMNYRMEELVALAPHLLQPNQSELVAMDIIASKGYDHVNLTILNKESKVKMVIIGRSFIQKFNSRYNEL